jgi:hypothetical protein
MVCVTWDIVAHIAHFNANYVVRSSYSLVLRNTGTPCNNSSDYPLSVKMAGVCQNDNDRSTFVYFMKLF